MVVVDDSVCAAAPTVATAISPATAAAILAWREEHGPFARIDDLMLVPGIGPAKLAAVRDLVTL